MASIYTLEPPTSGKVILITSVGDIEVELWCKECPLACRNFIQLCLEGYYDNTIFHRVVPGFIVQSGDPSGSGSGGMSIYGEAFKDEFHSRLKFNRRGLLAMANTGEKNDNNSQFFFTLDKTPELQLKNTLFGKIEGTTLYNMLKIGEGEVEGPDGDQPVYPVKLISTKVILNPYDDLVLRDVYKEEAKSEVKTKKITKKKKRNINLLSFSEDVEEAEGVNGGMKSSHELLTDDPTLSKEKVKLEKESSRITKQPRIETVKETEVKEKETENKEVKRKNKIEQGKEETQLQIEKLKRDIKELNNSKRKEDTKEDKKKETSGKETLKQTVEMYKKKNQIKLKDKKKNSEFVFDKLLQFQSKLSDIQPIQEDKVKGEEEQQLCRLHSLVNCESCEAFDKTFEKGMQKEKTMNESGWLAHKLSFPIEKKVGGDKFDDYEVIDPKLLAAGPIDKELERKKNYDKKAKY